MHKAGKVFLNKIYTGVLSFEEGRYVFVYDKQYLIRRDAKKIGIHFPLRAEPFYSPILFSLFFAMLSEGVLKEIQCQTLRIDETDYFKRLLKTSAVDTIGALMIEEIIS